LFKAEKIDKPENTGYMQQLAPVEQTVFQMTNPLIDHWRKTGTIDTGEAKNLGKSISELVETAWPQPL
jgi:hypothetical protein